MQRSRSHCDALMGKSRVCMEIRMLFVASAHLPDACPPPLSRDARRPSTLPSGLSGGPPGQFRHRNRDSRGLGSMAGGDVSMSEQSGEGLSPLRPSRLSRSYVTLLAAAAEEARAMTPGGAAGSGRIPGQGAHAIPRTDSSVSTSVMNAMAGGSVGSDVGEVSGRGGLGESGKMVSCQLRSV